MPIEGNTAAASQVEDTEPKPLPDKKDTLENLAELLVAFFNGVSSGNVSSVVQSTRSVNIETNALYVAYAVRVLCYAITGILLFGAAFVYHCCAGTLAEMGYAKTVQKIFFGRKRDIALSCLFALLGGILQATQMGILAAEKNEIVVGFGYLLIIFSGYLTGGGSLTNAAKSLMLESPEATQAPSDQASVEPASLAGNNQKTTLENYLRLILSFRNAAIAGAGTGLAYSATSTSVDVDRLLLNYAMIQLFFGTLVNLFTYASLLYDSYCIDRSKRVGAINTFNGHFSGTKLQITLAGKLAFFGALILILQSFFPTKNPVALQIAEWLLSASGFLTGSKVTALFARMKNTGAALNESVAETAAASSTVVLQSPHQDDDSGNESQLRQPPPTPTTPRAAASIFAREPFDESAHNSAKARIPQSTHTVVGMGASQMSRS